MIESLTKFTDPEQVADQRLFMTCLLQRREMRADTLAKRIKSIVGAALDSDYRTRNFASRHQLVERVISAVENEIAQPNIWFCVSLVKDDFQLLGVVGTDLEIGRNHKVSTTPDLTWLHMIEQWSRPLLVADLHHDKFNLSRYQSRQLTHLASVSVLDDQVERTYTRYHGQNGSTQGASPAHGHADSGVDLSSKWPQTWRSLMNEVQVDGYELLVVVGSEGIVNGLDVDSEQLDVLRLAGNYPGNELIGKLDRVKRDRFQSNISFEGGRSMLVYGWHQVAKALNRANVMQVFIDPRLKHVGYVDDDGLVYNYPAAGSQRVKDFVALIASKARQVGAQVKLASEVASDQDWSVAAQLRY